MNLVTNISRYELRMQQKQRLYPCLLSSFEKINTTRTTRRYVVVRIIHEITLITVIQIQIQASTTRMMSQEIKTSLHTRGRDRRRHETAGSRQWCTHSLTEIRPTTLYGHTVQYRQGGFLPPFLHSIFQAAKSGTASFRCTTTHGGFGGRE